MTPFWRVAALVPAFIGLASASHAQMPKPPAVRPTTPIIKPQPSIDPGMKVAPKRDLHLPTPVIKPHPEQGDTVVVPK